MQVETNVESDKIIKHFTPQIIQNLKVLMYLNRVAKLKQDHTAFTPSFALLPVPVKLYLLYVFY